MHQLTDVETSEFVREENLAMPNVSIVVISKNQEWNIARLLDSVFEWTMCIPKKEIFLVDSASTDKTIDIGRTYPINILRLRPDQPLTPAAGRYVGYKHTSSDLILFLDGDMELYNGWLERALKLIEAKPEVAVITGQVIHLPKESFAPNKLDQETSCIGESFFEVQHSGGAALYRRSVLEQVGMFNPYLHSDEEPELCLRIRNAGFRIICLEYPIAYHYTSPVDTLSTLISRRRRNLWLGMGQSMRYHLGTELFWQYIKERGYGCMPLLGLTTGLILFLWSLISHQWMWVGSWFLLFSILVIGDACRKQSFYRTIYSLLQRLFVIEGTVRGFFLTPLDPDRYPGRVDVIHRMDSHSKQTRVVREDNSSIDEAYIHAR